MHPPDRWSASSLKAPLNGSLRRAHSGRPHPGLSGQARWRRPFSRRNRTARLCRNDDTTKQGLADELVARGYVVLLVDSYATRGIDHACTSSAFATFLGAGRMPTGLWSSWLAKPSSIHSVWLRSASRLAPGFPSRWESPDRSNRSSLQATCGSGRRRRSIRHEGGRGASGDTHAGLHRGPRRMDASGRLLEKDGRLGRPRATSRARGLSRRVHGSITHTSSPAGPCSVTGWNTTARPRTTQLTVCAGFSIATSTEGVPSEGQQNSTFPLRLRSGHWR